MSSGIPDLTLADFVDETGMPRHIPMRFTKDGQGPADERDGAYWGCWCGDKGCTWNMAFANERSLARETTLRALHKAVRGYVMECQRRAWPVTAKGLLQHLEDLKL